MKRLLALIGVAGVALAAQGQVPLTSGANYEQDFNALAASVSGENATVRWTNNATLQGWYASSLTNGAYTQYRVSGGEVKLNGLYTFGTNGAGTLTDRALGSIASASPVIIAFGVRFKNDTSNTMTNVVVSYTGEQWRNSTDNGAAQTLEFSYGIADTVADLQPGATVEWTRVAPLDFIRLKYGGGAAELDGNASGNRTKFDKIQLPGATLKPGEELFLRWQDADDPGQNDHGLAIDDLTVSFTSAR